MPRAEAGTTKYLNNKLKSKGLQRLRWYCQACERQMRDENGFKCHTQSESHVRQMLLVGEDSKKYISDFSNQFQRDFLLQLRTAHGEKKILMNHFYQEYIANKEHVHMNATRWPSLTEFAKFLGREGICRVEETDKGLEIAWIDNSPEALRRQDAIRKKDRQDKGDEEREQRLIKQQIARAQQGAEDKNGDTAEQKSRLLERADGESVRLNLGTKQAGKKVEEQSESRERRSSDSSSSIQEPQPQVETSSINKPSDGDGNEPGQPKQPVKLSIGKAPKPKNVFASSSKKNPLQQKKRGVGDQPQKPMSEVERIMKEEMNRAKNRTNSKFGPPAMKKQRVS